IKPSNLMLTRATARSDGLSESSECVVKVLDLGLALLSDSHGEFDANISASGRIMGTLHYMAPEQGLDSHRVDVRADVYSLGATLFKLLTGEPPFPESRYNSPVRLLMAVANTDPPSVGSRRRLPAKLIPLIDSMVARDPARRPPTAADVAQALAPFAFAADLRQLPLKSELQASRSAVDTLQLSRSVDVDTAERDLSSQSPAPVKALPPVRAAAAPSMPVRITTVPAVLRTLKHHRTTAGLSVAAGLMLTFAMFSLTGPKRSSIEALPALARGENAADDYSTASGDFRAPDPGASPREFAEWFLTGGHSLIVETEDSLYRCQSADRLPEDVFRITGLMFGDPFTVPDYADTVNDEWINRISAAGLPELRSLTVHRQTNISLSEWQALFSAAPLLESVSVTTDRPLPGAWCRELAALPTLRSLSLTDSGALLAMQDYLRSSSGDPLPQLAELKLSGSLQELIPQLHRLPGVTRLELRDQYLSDAELKQISAVTELQVLRIGRCEISRAGVEHLARLKQLRLLEIGTHDMRTGAAWRYRDLCEPLRSELPSCEIRVPHGFAVTTLPSMTGEHIFEERSWKTETSRRAAEWVLSIPGSEVFADPSFAVTDVKRLPAEPFELQIVRLNCEQKPMSDDDLRHLSDLTALRNLYLRHAPTLAGTGLSSLRASPLAVLECEFPLSAPAAQVVSRQFPELRYLDLPNQDVSDDVLRHLNSLRNLESLTLFHSRYSAAGLAGLNWPDLRRMNLSHSPLTADHIRALRGLPRLEYLVLESCDLSGDKSTALAELPALRHVIVTAGRCSHDQLRELSKSMPRCRITVLPDGGRHTEHFDVIDGRFCEPDSQTPLNI
ncbi:MAG: protein kinase, partial [Planctomycetaceae bacterium]|nr:protein kinase [Planctomycetaceae bacterium]